MEKNKVLILGRGYLSGRYLQFFQKTGEVVASPVDITDLVALEAVIQEVRPEIVINGAGKTNTGAIEKAENRAEAYRVNVQGPANLAYLAPEYGYRLVLLSTGMMYHGAGPLGDGFREDEAPSPTCYYAWTKAWSDYQLQPFLEANRIMVLRLHLPTSQISHPRNLLNKLQGFSQVCTEPSSLTVVEDLLEATRILLEKKAIGIFNVVNSGTISLYNVTQMMQRAGKIDPTKTVRPITSAELNTLTDAAGKARQTFPVLNISKLEAAGVKMPEVRQAVDSCIKNL